MAFDFNAYLFTQNSNINWPRQYGYPRVGASIVFLDLGTPITGKVFGLLPFVEFKLTESRNQELNVRLSSGLGYVTRKWNLEENLLNKATGSHLNAAMRVHFMYHKKVTENIELTGLLGMTHFSNGNFRMPNLGVNSVEAGIGLNFNPKGKPSTSYPFAPDSSARTNRTEIQISGATKVTGLVYGKRIYVGQVGLRQHFRCRQKSRFSAGFDVFYDRGHFYRDNPDNAQGKPRIKETTELGILLGHSLLMGNLQLITELGTYLYAPEWNKGLFYQRIGFKYEINQNWALRSILKTHFARADYFEWGISYTLLR
jgi:hypothetical protein